MIAFALAVGLFGPMIASAQTKPDDADRAREAAALNFARKHHPELADLLERLKATDRNAYQKAVRDVSQAGERIARLRENDPERYELALRVWTLDSRIRLLAARSTMSDDPSIDDRLRELLRERREIRLAMLRLERERLRTRLERVEDQLELLDRDPDKAVENDLARIKRGVKASANRARRAPAKGDAAKADGKRRRPAAGEGKAGDAKAPSKPERKPSARKFSE